MNKLEEYNEDEERYNKIVIDDSLADEFNEDFEVDD